MIIKQKDDNIRTSQIYVYRHFQMKGSSAVPIRIRLVITLWVHVSAFLRV